MRPIIRVETFVAALTTVNYGPGQQDCDAIGPEEQAGSRQDAGEKEGGQTSQRGRRDGQTTGCEAAPGREETGEDSQAEAGCKEAEAGG